MFKCVVHAGSRCVCVCVNGSGEGLRLPCTRGPWFEFPPSKNSYNLVLV